LTNLVSGTGVQSKTLEKTGKAGRLLWISQLTQALCEGLEGSQWLADVRADEIAAGRQICLDLWPFIAKLPDNIKAVKEKLPPNLEPARLFLTNLADDERNHQAQYIKQCELAGLSSQDLLTSEAKPIASIAKLVEAMRSACRDGDVLCGVEAIVAAELAATQLARTVQEAFEVYFERHAAEYEPQQIEEGLAWVRLHASPNTRHAIWMSRMLLGLQLESSQDQANRDLPETVKEIVGAIFCLWGVDRATSEKWLR
jgi:hypothetical protein